MTEGQDTSISAKHQLSFRGGKTHPKALLVKKPRQYHLPQYFIKKGQILTCFHNRSFCRH